MRPSGRDTAIATPRSVGRGVRVLRRAYGFFGKGLRACTRDADRQSALGVPLVSPLSVRFLASAAIQISELLRDKVEVVVDMVRVDLDDLKKVDLAALRVHPNPRERLAR